MDLYEEYSYSSFCEMGSTFSGNFLLKCQLFEIFVEKEVVIISIMNEQSTKGIPDDAPRCPFGHQCGIQTGSSLVYRRPLYQHLSANTCIIFSFFCCSRFICFWKSHHSHHRIIMSKYITEGTWENYHRKTWGIRWNILSRVGNKSSGRKGNMRHFKNWRRTWLS